MGSRDDQFWAEFLGVQPSDWSVAGISIRPHAGLSGYCGLWCFRRGDRTVVSAPASWVTTLASRIDVSLQDRLFEEAFLRQMVGDAFDSLIGPAFQGCLDPRRFRPVSSENVRFVKPNDAPAIARLREACSPADWEHSGLDRAPLHQVAYFEDSMITAMAGYRPRNDVTGDPCVLTHPRFYGRGHGTAVVSAVVQRALEQDKLVLYQTLEANRGAVGIAFKLGYEQYARHVAVGLKRDRPEHVDE